MKNCFHVQALRKTILDMAYAGATVHIGCAFSLVEILAVLYRNHLRFPENKPDSPFRDYLVLSKGHGVMAQYACLYEKEWLTDSDIKQYFKNGTRLKGLADAHVPGVEVTSGSLGHGLSVAVGLALAAKRNNTEQMVYAIVGDGEINEGSIWEAVLCANQFRLDNLVVIVDENGFQAMGSTSEILALDDITLKFKAFGFDAQAVNGHDEVALDKVVSDIKTWRNGKPKAVVAKTIKGKGVSFMENNNIWHYTRLNKETYQAALKEIEESNA